jgi:hypothetical protein
VTTTDTTVLTAAEAATLCDALDVIEAIDQRCREYDNTTGSRADAYGRLGGIATVADKTLFTLLNVASNYLHDEKAAAALNRHLGRDEAA